MHRREFLTQTGCLAAVFASARERIDQVSIDPWSGHEEYAHFVFIELSGGSDGLNMIVPFRNDHYYRRRPHLALCRDQLLLFEAEFGFHPSLLEMQKLYGNGYVAVIHGAGFPESERSHFRARRLWRSALPFDICEFPELDFETSLGQIAGEIAADSGGRLFRTCLRGFDTHMTQVESVDPHRGRQVDLFRRLDSTLGHFMASLRRYGKIDSVVVMLSSEFGRTVSENEMMGTDHGTANPVLIIGNKVKGGLYGTFPSLNPEQCDETGEPFHTVDFRSVSATLFPTGMSFDFPASIPRLSLI